jgi:hypothetical protein
MGADARRELVSIVMEVWRTVQVPAEPTRQ